jgi:hypothetical protein
MLRSSGQGRDGTLATGSRSTLPDGHGCDKRRVLSTGWRQTVDNALLESETGREPGLAEEGSSSTEGTSGAADLGVLRGAPGEAALGLGNRLREQRGGSTVPSDAMVSAQAVPRGVPFRSAVPPACNGKVQRAPCASGTHGGTRASCFFARAGLVWRDRQGRSASAEGDRRCRFSRPALPRSRDERCPSDPSQGKVLAGVCRPAFGSRAFTARAVRGVCLSKTRKEELGGLPPAPDPRELG